MYKIEAKKNLLTQASFNSKPAADEFVKMARKLGYKVKVVRIVQ